LVSALDRSPLSGSTTPTPRLLDPVCERLRTKPYSIRTESPEVFWIRRFSLFYGKRHPREIHAPEVEAFLPNLALHGRVVAATQHQALSVLLLLYREVLGLELPWQEGLTRAKRPQRLRGVLPPASVPCSSAGRACIT
jgi:hypothetical protein